MPTSPAAANWLVSVVSLHMLAATAALAQPADDFYNGREIKLVVGFTTGGGADIYARTIARHMVRHIPGKPTITLQFMPGAGSLTAANWLYNVAPRDGSVIGSIHSSVTLEPLYGFERAKLDVMKFTWLGSASTDYGVTLTWGTSPVKTLADARQREVLVGGLGPGSASDFTAILLNQFAGTKFKVVSGYRGVNDILLAMERGEVDGIGSWAWTALNSFKPDWVPGKKVNILLQQSSEPHPDITARGVPFILDLVERTEDRRVVELGLAFMGDRPALCRPARAAAAARCHPEARVRRDDERSGLPHRGGRAQDRDHQAQDRRGSSMPCSAASMPRRSRSSSACCRCRRRTGDVARPMWLYTVSPQHHGLQKARSGRNG